MGRIEHEATMLGDGFALGDWLVQPDLNRVSRGVSAVQLEPKLMDLLVFLAERGGRVVSKDELVDGVWKIEFISEWAITRAIAKLRRALGDDAAAPRYIETISKRGYRLIAAVGADPQTTPGDRPARQGATGTARVRNTPTTPFVVGGWVRGPHFYGRRTQIAEILDGQRDFL